MKKEFIKTVVLTCLVLSSLVLSAHIWHEKELWSLDYNSFVHSLKNLFAEEGPEERQEGNTIPYWNELSPEFVSFTFGSQRMICYQASPQFPEANRMASEVLSSVEKDGSLATVTEEEYLNSYKTNSMMIKFPSRVNLQELLGKEDAFFDAVTNPITSTLVIGIGDSKTTYLTFMDDSSGHAYQLPVKIFTNIETLKERIALVNQNASYAYELKFDENAGNTQRILFDRFVPIVLDPVKIHRIEALPVPYSSAYDSVFKAFHIVKNSARSYRDKAGAIHFIENRSTLKILADGGFHFETSDPEAGIGLGEKPEQEVVTEFVNLLYRSIVPESDGYLMVMSYQEQENRHIYEFMYHTPNGFLYQKNGPAVRVVCEDGVIMKYEQTLLDLKIGEQISMPSGIIEAYDLLYQQSDIADKSKQRIRSMVPCHVLENGTITAGWYCRFSDGSVSCLTP